MHSSRMRTVRSSSRLSRGVCLSDCRDTNQPLPRHPPGADTPSRKQTPTPLGSKHPPGADTHPPGADIPPGPGSPLWTDRRLEKHNLRNFVAYGNNIFTTGISSKCLPSCLSVRRVIPSEQDEVEKQLRSNMGVNPSSGSRVNVRAMASISFGNRFYVYQCYVSK